MNVDDKEVMETLTKMVVEQFTQEMAEKARQFARTMPAGISGSDALLAFAAAIESTNGKLYPQRGTKQ